MNKTSFLLFLFQNLFQEYLNEPGNPRWEDDITKDLHRQFPQHEMFTSKGSYG